MEPKTYAEVLTGNFRAARARAGLGQEAVAARMRALGFAEWRYQTVGVVENGKRRLTGEEIMALAQVLETSVFTLMKPPDELGEVRLRSGDLISGRSIALSLAAHNDGAVTWHGADGAEPEFTLDKGDKVAHLVITPPPAPGPADGEADMGGRRPGA